MEMTNCKVDGMRKIVHIEDCANWRANVRKAVDLVENTSLSAFDSLNDFRKAGYPSASLYVLDRHLPELSGGHPNNDNWKLILRVIDDTHPGIIVPVVLFSNHVPVDFRRYSRNLVEGIRKQDYSESNFEAERFAEILRRYL